MRSPAISLCPRCRRQLCCWTRFTVEDLEDIKLAVSEAVSNCVIHAYPGPGEARPTVLMVMEARESEFVVSIEDKE